MASRIISRFFSVDGSPPGAGVWALWAALAFPGTLFALKYGDRAGIPVVAACVGYWVFFVIQLVVARWAAGKVARAAHGRRIVWAGVAVYAALLFIIYRRIDPEQLQIDRWSALDRFWDALSRGEYPYVRTHLGSYISGFPGLFAAAYPFWLLGDVGLIQFAALAAFTALVTRAARDAASSAFVLILLVGAPVYVYEILVRSELFSNMTLIAGLVHVGNRPGAFAGRRILLAAAAWGLVLSTRAVAILPLALVAFPLLKGRSPGMVVLSGLALAGTFLATLLPFFLWATESFREVNPFFVQSGAMPGWAVASVLAASLWIGFRYRASPRLFAHAGAMLFLAVFASWAIKSFRLGWGVALWENGFDISYFALPLPFLLLHLASVLRLPPARRAARVAGDG